MAAGALILSFAGHPMQSQSWHEKEEYDYYTQLYEKQQNQSAEFFLVDFEQVRRPRNRSVPKQNRRGEVEQREYRPMIKAQKKKFRKKMILSRSLGRLF
ncbi:MAG: hypothetical protein DME31_00135 [Verrucomicrobia bacterium]|nr:MAG: hypothetical protein DME31_00135 [Verrucomicrobiota bacterium]